MHVGLSVPQTLWRLCCPACNTGSHLSPSQEVNSLLALNSPSNLLVQVRYLKVIEKSGYQALPWVRYITTAGEYEIRMT